MIWPQLYAICQTAGLSLKQPCNCARIHLLHNRCAWLRRYPATAPPTSTSSAAGVSSSAAYRCAPPLTAALQVQGMITQCWFSSCGISECADYHACVKQPRCSQYLTAHSAVGAAGASDAECRRLWARGQRPRARPGVQPQRRLPGPCPGTSGGGISISASSEPVIPEHQMDHIAQLMRRLSMLAGS